MPHARPTLGHRDVLRVCAEAFLPSGPDCYGVEAEWPLHLDGIGRRPSLAEVERWVSIPLPHSRVTFEPGGQIELSTSPAATIAGALAALDADGDLLDRHLRADGFCRGAAAVDAGRPPQRVLEHARYRAMESYLAARGPAGAWMMCATSSTQVNLSHDEEDALHRWVTLNRIAPLLVGAFANSPGVDWAGRRWACLRQAIWWETDPCRTRPVRLDLPPAVAWAQYALDADVLVVRDGEDGSGWRALRPGLTFRRWLTSGHPCGWPVEADLRYHLSTLFPPVRPRGWLEVRVLDALPAAARTVACLVIAAAATAGAGRELTRELGDTRHLWLPATRHGLRSAAVAAAVDVLFAAATPHLAQVDDDPAHRDLVEQYRHTHVEPRRMPADEAGAVDLRVTRSG